MREPNGVGPFRPGVGGLPPCLAGREAERAYFRECLETLRQRESAPSEVIVYGPRGNGKTALLRSVEVEAEAACGLDTCWLTGVEVTEPAALARRLGLGPPAAETPGDPHGLAEALQARARVKPLLVLLDEAHTLKPEVGQWLLNAAQTAGSRAPFLLVLAGTPDLRARLAETGAAFWSRGKKLAIGRLTEDEAAEAVSRPLAAEGIEFEADALARIARESDGYPFFTQVWGRAVWRVMVDGPDGVDTVTTTVVEAAAAEFESRKNHYYLDRFMELHRGNLLGAARRVAEAFHDRSTIPFTVFDDAIAEAANGEMDVVATGDALAHLGLVWQTKGVPDWEPGLPGLLDYILEHAPDPRGD